MCDEQSGSGDDLLLPLRSGEPEGEHVLLLLREDAEPVKPAWFPRDIHAPVSEAEHEAVRVAQRALRLVPTGDMDEPTKASLRGTQRLYGLPVTGILDEGTAVVIDGLRPYQIEKEDRPWRPY
jgi:hypothetical protein